MFLVDQMVKKGLKTEENALKHNPRYKERLEEFRKLGYTKDSFFKVFDGKTDRIGLFIKKNTVYHYVKK